MDRTRLTARASLPYHRSDLIQLERQRAQAAQQETADLAAAWRVIGRLVLGAIAVWLIWQGAR